MRFRDRAEAGRRLAQQLRSLDLVNPVILALPRGGVPVAAEIASFLHAPLEVFVARKVGAPHQPEFGIGAVAEGGEALVNPDAVRSLTVTPQIWEGLVAEERRELERRVERYRRGRPLPDVRGRDVVLVDDGLATGVTAEAALRALRSGQPRRLVLAVPACAPEAAERLAVVADEVICVLSPSDFRAVGLWYEHFAQTTDQEVLDLLERSNTPTPAGTQP